MKQAAPDCLYIICGNFFCTKDIGVIIETKLSPDTHIDTIWDKHEDTFDDYSHWAAIWFDNQGTPHYRSIFYRYRGIPEYERFGPHALEHMRNNYSVDIR